MLQRRIDAGIGSTQLRTLTNPNTTFNDNSVPTYGDTLEKLIEYTGEVRKALRLYNRIDAQEKPADSEHQLRLLLTNLQLAAADLDWLIPALSNTQNQTLADKRTYTVLINYRSQMTRLSRAVNDEIAGKFNIHRAGPGGRPDANTQNAIEGTLNSGALGLGGQEQQFLNTFVQNQGGSWKEKREALSAIWAKRGGLFNNLTPGKGNDYGVDVEYQTTDQGKPELWDQKTIYTDQNGFDGRLEHTHTKNTDDQGHGVGLLFDSTFENRTNYEKNWLGISSALLSGHIAPEAVLEVVAPNPQALRADIFVNMAQQYPQNGVEANIKWAEAKRANAQQHGLEVINQGSLNGTNLANILQGNVNSYSRYKNDRDWLPDGVYNEFPATGMPNQGMGRFVISDDNTRIYLTVTHYKGFTVQDQQGTANRNPFYRVV
ncbi:MAG: hypothetical protein OHK0022_38470 [Roseiflexaceae bacterium]